MLKAVNLGGDTDTVGSITGSIAGLLYGIQAVPDIWIENLVSKEKFEPIISEFMTT